MKLFNNTPMEAYWGVNVGNAHDCGKIAASKTLDFPRFDNQKNVKVAFNAAGSKTPPGEPTLFSVVIPQSGTGMEVIIGLYQQ